MQMRLRRMITAPSRIVLIVFGEADPPSSFGYASRTALKRRAFSGK
jgi:hypothetical protein